MQIRRARHGDFLAIAQLDRRAWTNNRNNQFIADGEHVWRIWVEHALTFCAIQEGQIVGAIIAFACESGQYCVHKVFVDNRLRGRGVGGQLFKELLVALDKLRVSSFLTVDPVNTAALSLYDKWGYCQKKLIKGYYREQEDRYILTRAARCN